MTNAIAKKEATAPAAPQRVSVINALASRLECDPQKLMPMLKKTAFATCKTDEEFMAMCMVANTYNLNPILKEVYAFPAQKGQVVPIVGVDGWIKLMNANPAFDGIDFDEGDGYCTAVIYRKDRTHPVRVTEWLSECGGTTEPWRRWPRRMLRHKAMIQCARVAFGFAGIYDEDEARRIASVGGGAEAAPETEPAAPKPTGKGRLRSALGIGNGGKDAAPAPAAPAPAADAGDAESAADREAAPEPGAGEFAAPGDVTDELALI